MMRLLAVTAIAVFSLVFSFTVGANGSAAGKEIATALAHAEMAIATA